MLIPKIVHQVWEGRTSTIPKYLETLSRSWKELNPDYEYHLWGDDEMVTMVKQNYPHMWKIYDSFPEDVQRWDTIRYMILSQFGGIYADLDSECLESLDKLLEEKSCCFGIEPPQHAKNVGVNCLIGNAFMAAVPNQPFFDVVLSEIMNYKSIKNEDRSYVLTTTGPLMINRAYERYLRKNEIQLCSYELVTPLTKREVLEMLNGKETKEISDKVERAYAIHYFFGSWY